MRLNSPSLELPNCMVGTRPDDYLNMGPSIKDIRIRGGGGVSQKRTPADAGGRGVSGKMRTSSKFKFLPKFSNFILSVPCAKRQHSTQ